MVRYRTEHCDVNGCHHPHRAGGYCRAHYANHRKWGNPFGKWGPREDGKLFRFNKLSDRAAAEIRRRYVATDHLRQDDPNKATMTQLAREFNVSVSTISRAVNATAD